MKTIGLLGGMSWESTVTYYQIINEIIKERLGGLNSAKILLYSVNFQEIEECQSKGEWERSAQILGEAAKNLEGAGADFIVICTNTMHKTAPEIQKQINIPLIHIAEATAKELKKDNIKKAALLGTKYTMKQDFYKEKIISSGIEVFIPDDPDADRVNHIIFDELCRGVIKEESKDALLSIIEKLASQGAQGVILGCTEIGLLIKQEQVSIPVFDTTKIHAKAAAIASLQDCKII